MYRFISMQLFYWLVCLSCLLFASSLRWRARGTVLVSVRPSLTFAVQFRWKWLVGSEPACIIFWPWDLQYSNLQCIARNLLHNSDFRHPKLILWRPFKNYLNSSNMALATRDAWVRPIFSSLKWKMKSLIFVQIFSVRLKEVNKPQLCCPIEAPVQYDINSL